jgi:amidase
VSIRFDEYVQHDALGLADLVRRGEVHASELLDVALARTDQTHGQLNAVIRRLDARARQRCKQAFDPASRFPGVPFLVKDLFQEVAGEHCGSGSRALQHVVADHSADVTRRWEAQGLVIFGMTNTPEFGAKGITEPLAYGPAHNPWALNRSTGGSSGGSAAAVAAGIVPVAGANDGGGSIRVPSSACGLFGLKAGRGRISVGPTMAEGMNGSAVQGVVSRSVRDTAAMLDTLQGPELHAPYYMPAASPSYLDAIATPPGRLRIGFTTASPIGTPVSPDAVAAVKDAAQLLASLGHHVEEASPAIDGAQMAQDFFLNWFALMAMMVEEACQRAGARWRDFEPDTRAMVSVGKSLSAIELQKAQLNWHTHTLALAQFHSQYDLWLTPTLSEVALPLGQLDTPPALHILNDLVNLLGLSRLVRKTPMFQDSILKNLAWTPFTPLANLTGRPAMSVPLYWNPQGLPLGVQFVAPLNGETTLLQLAAQLEQARPWFDRRAPWPPA